MYSFYLDNVLLPVTPEQLILKVKNRNKTIDLASGGELNLAKAPGLTEISFDMLLPSMQYPFARYADGFQTPNYYLDHLERLKTGRIPFDFIVIRTVTAQMLLQSAAGFRRLPEDVIRQYDVDGNGKITANEARLLMIQQNGRTDLLENTRMKCLLESYTITENAEKLGRDFSVAVTLKQYVEYGIKHLLYSMEKKDGAL